MSNQIAISEDEYTTDEEELIRDFDQEAELIINSDTLPKKSADRYLQVYEAYKKWENDNKNRLSSIPENNLIIYFKSLEEKLKPSTMWSIWSMLKKTLNNKEHIDINRFLNLKAMLKNNSKGYKPSKSQVLKWEDIEKFIKEADDNKYLAIKVILIFGISGALRCDEIANLRVQDVEELSDKRYLISIQNTKNYYNSHTTAASRQLLIGSLFFEIVQKYISLRPTKEFTDRFFIRYQEGKCICQVIGINKVYEIPQIIASYLDLKDPKTYTGHCFRRTGATLLADSGASFDKIKQLGGWVSDKVCHGYVENSMHNRQQIFDGVTKGTLNSAVVKTQPDISNRPSTSRDQCKTNAKREMPPVEIYWDDFDTEIIIDNVDRAPIPISKESQELQSVFVTAKNNLITTNPQSSSKAPENFSLKTPIKLSFKDKSAQPPVKIAKINIPQSINVNNHREETVIENEEINADTTNWLNNSCIKYVNCSFNGSIINNYCCKNCKK